MPNFKVTVGLEYYLLQSTSPVKVQGEPVAFGEPAYVEVTGVRYWCHFDPDAYLPDGEDEPTPEQLADAVELACRKPVAVYQVGHPHNSQVEMLQDGFDFETGDGDGDGEMGGGGDDPDGDGGGDGDGELDEDGVPYADDEDNEDDEQPVDAAVDIDEEPAQPAEKEDKE